MLTKLTLAVLWAFHAANSVFDARVLGADVVTTLLRVTGLPGEALPPKIWLTGPVKCPTGTEA